MRPWFTLAAAGVAAGLGLWAWQSNDKHQAPPAPAAPEAAAPAAQLTHLPVIEYPDIDGELRNSAEWKDKTVVLNFWATWCPPCREETPLFVALQEEYADKGVQFIGLAIDDKEAVIDFADSYGVDYPMLLGDIEVMQLAKQLGNRFGGLPYTVVAAPGGEIVARHYGGMKREQLEPLLKRLSGGGGQ